MLPRGCPETDPFRRCILESIWKQTDAQNYFVRPARKYACAVFRQKLAPELDLVLVFGFALGGSDARQPFGFSKNHRVRRRNAHIDFRAAGDQGVGVGDAAPEGDFGVVCLCIRQVDQSEQVPEPEFEDVLRRPGNGAEDRPVYGVLAVQGLQVAVVAKARGRDF